MLNFISIFTSLITEIYGVHLFQHCDALLNLLCLKARQAPHMFRQNWTCVDFFFWVSYDMQIPINYSPLLLNVVKYAKFPQYTFCRINVECHLSRIVGTRL